ncbi:MAG TPA: outer membrane beta-barrel protein, partial [Dyadobacter sp.]|nr:outer membrane beta-barrel protein [Dyadobacter sp.]
SPYIVERDFSRWRYGVHGGYSYRTGKISNNVSQVYKDYLKSLKSGFTLGGDIHYFISESIGLGVVYGLNKHKATMSGAEDNVTMHYVGASVLNRYILANPQKHFILGLNMGYQSYLDKAKVTGDNFNISGSTLGLGLEAGFEQELSAGTLIHFGLGFKASTLTKIKVNQNAPIKLDKENFENLGRLELTVGLKFGK